MHTFVAVLVPSDTMDILQKVTDLLAPYEANRANIVPQKVYIEGEDLQRLAEYAGLPVEDLPHLADYVLEWAKITSGMVDDRGLFYIKSEGCWDYWKIGGRWDGVIQGKSRNTRGRSNYGPEHEQLQYNLCPVSELPKDVELSAEVLITPDGQWHEGRDYPNAEFGRRQWNKVFWELANEHRDCIAVGVDTHF